jgi:hypothetical protein
LHLGVAQVEQMPGAVEPKALLAQRDGVTARHRFAFEQPMRDPGPAQEQAGGKPGEATAQDRDRESLGSHALMRRVPIATVADRHFERHR